MSPAIEQVRTRCFNRELTMEMIVGTFIASVFVVLVAFTIVISGSRLLSGGRHEIEVTFENVGALRVSDSVLMRGVAIGRVEALKLEGDSVRVRLSLRHDLALKTGYRFRVEPSSVLGGNQLVIEEGRGSPLPEGTRLRGETPANVMEGVGTLIEEVRRAFGEGQFLTNLQQVAHNLAEISGRIRRGEGTVGRLLSSDDSLYRDLADTAASARTLAGRLERGEGILGKLFSADGRLYDDLSSSAASLRTMANRLERGEGTLGKLLSSDEQMYGDLRDATASLKAIAGRIERGEGSLGRFLAPDDRLYADLAAAAESIRKITGRVEAGEGVLGQLTSKDGKLSTDVMGLVKDARDTIDDMRESSPIVTFTSIFLGVF
jgi:phospholipid/cholesterol/gamma-HCH transport system substrate-binding protein